MTPGAEAVAIMKHGQHRVAIWLEAALADGPRQLTTAAIADGAGTCQRTVRRTIRVLRERQVIRTTRAREDDPYTFSLIRRLAREAGQGVQGGGQIDRPLTPRRGVRLMSA